MTKYITKELKWSEMQESEHVADNKAFYELSLLDILKVFELEELYATGNYLSNVEETSNWVTKESIITVRLMIK